MDWKFITYQSLKRNQNYHFAINFPIFFLQLLTSIAFLILSYNISKAFNYEKDEETAALDRYNKKVIASNRVEAVLFPIRDGLMISRKIK